MAETKYGLTTLAQVVVQGRLCCVNDDQFIVAIRFTATIYNATGFVVSTEYWSRNFLHPVRSCEIQKICPCVIESASWP